MSMHDLRAKRALITGITGQDGAYLAALLLNKGYEVHGLQRRLSSDNTWRIRTVLQAVNPAYHHRLILHYGDMTDTASLMRIIALAQPEEIYNLAAQSHVAVSFETPEYTAQVDAIGITRLLEAIRATGLTKSVRLYQASSSELFGKTSPIMQNEHTPFNPQSPYAIAKLYAYWMITNYRAAYDMFACNGILFNHESPLRDESFVTRKITSTIARIHHGSDEILCLGNLNAQRDWGYAPDYVHAMWLMLQQNMPDDFVIATGQTHSVKQFVEQACAEISLPLVWDGSGLHERGINSKTGMVVVKIDPRYFRPTEVDFLHGDATKARLALGWQPTIMFSNLVKIMIHADLERAKDKTSYANKWPSHHFEQIR